MRKKIIIFMMVFITVLSLTGCGKKKNSSSSETASYTSKLTTDKIFTERDLKQTVDTEDATTYTVTDNKDITIKEEGIYVITGNASNASIIVDTTDDAKVQLVLKDLTITNDSNPCIYVKNANKTFVTTTGTNSLSVNGTFTKDGETNLDAVIFSKDDITLNGTGTLNITSTANGVTSKDDLVITGGTININCTNDALEANNSISIKDGTITINSKKDGLHAEYTEDDSKGYIYIAGGTLDITATDDSVHATTVLQIDDGKITTNSREGFEGTYIQINGGTININASDDGINAASQSKSYSATIEINGGNTTVTMGQGDTDGVDSNGDIIINGGTISVTGQSTFDYDGTGTINGGTVICNGEQVTTLPNQMMGGPGGNGGNKGRR